MSDYGVFEASSTDGHDEEQRQRQAKRDLGTAIEAAREGFGDFLGSASDKQDYSDRLALVMNDLMQKVADSGVMPVPGVMRKVKAALRPEFRTAAPQTISDADKAKVIPAGSTEIPQSAVASALEAGERVYGLSPSGSEILAIRNADTDAQFYWVAGSGSMWDVSANRRAAGWRDEVGQSVDEYLDATSTPRIAPHPEYGEGVWSDEGVKQRVLSLDPNLPTPELVDAIMREMGDYYDSIDRELAFWYFSQVTGNDYDDYYNAWMNIPSGKYFSTRKVAGDLDDFESWVSEEANSVYDLASASRYLSTFPSGEEPFNNDPDALLYAYENQFSEASRRQSEFDPNISDENLLAGLQIAEALNHDGSNQAKVDELRAEARSRGILSSRKQANDDSYTVHDTGVVEVFDADAYLDAFPDADIVTDNANGRMWDDSVVTSLTPTPGARSPFEYDASRKIAEVPWYKRWDRTEDEVLDELHEMEGVLQEAIQNGYDSRSAEDRIRELKDELAHARSASRKHTAETFQPGDKVMKSGYPGTVQNEYMDGMYEVRMERGTVVVPAEELTRVSSRKQAADHLDAPGVDMSQLRLDGLGNYGDAVAVVFDDSGNAVDLALNWETAQSMAQEGYDVQVVRGDGGRSQDEIQRMVDYEKELRRDLYGSRKQAGTVTIYTETMTQEDIDFGASGEVTEDVYTNVSVDEAVDILERHGLVDTGNIDTFYSQDSYMDPYSGNVEDLTGAITGFSEAEEDEIASRLRTASRVSRRKHAYTWRFDDMGMGDLGWESWWTVPEETAEAASGLMGVIAEDGTGQGGYNWSVVDTNNNHDIASGNEATVDAAKSAVERAL